MKICPKCQEKYEDSACFCNNCGERLASCGNTPSGSDSPPIIHGTGGRTYPFFLDSNETALAVIGEDAAESDLAGTWQKPYAVLTQEHFYCKNERGNFIHNSSELLSAAEEVPRFSGKVVFWLGFLISFGMNFIVTFEAFGDNLLYMLYMVPFLLCGVASAILHRKKGTSICPAILLLISLGPLIIIPIPVPFMLMYLFIAVRNRKYSGAFAITCANNTYRFSLKDYPKEEFANFASQLPQSRDSAAHTKPRVNKRVVFAGAVVLLVILAVIAAFRSSSAEKEPVAATPKVVTCNVCDGSGKCRKSCRYCGGQGISQGKIYFNDGNKSGWTYDGKWTTCSYCEGTGVCSSCKGSGWCQFCGGRGKKLE